MQTEVTADMNTSCELHHTPGMRYGGEGTKEKSHSIIIIIII
ncbi:unnamed protein product [Musa textilis]